MARRFCEGDVAFLRGLLAAARRARRRSAFCRDNGLCREAVRRLMDDVADRGGSWRDWRVAEEILLKRARGRLVVDRKTQLTMLTMAYDAAVERRVALAHECGLGTAEALMREMGGLA